MPADGERYGRASSKSTKQERIEVRVDTRAHRLLLLAAKRRHLI